MNVYTTMIIQIALISANTLTLKFMTVTANMPKFILIVFSVFTYYNELTFFKFKYLLL